MNGPKLATFVSPHGFGHAARASAVMEALARRVDARFEVFAASPRWFFDETIEGLYRLHELRGDVGFVQRSALAHDARATVEAVRGLVPFDEDLVDGLALEVRLSGARAVLCDIAPLGVAVAERAGVPSILVENFTWPWLYEPLFEEAPELEPLSEILGAWFGRATFHIQTEPLCHRDPAADLYVPPIGRPRRRGSEEVRAALGIASGARVVVMTMGGVPEELPFLRRLHDVEDVTFLVTGAPVTAVEGNVHLFENTTRIYMPDFVGAADAVVAKLGYSTVAEVWREGRPLAFVTRADFRETGPLRRWVQGELPGFEIPGGDFAEGAWVDRVPELLAMRHPPERAEGGAEMVAAFIEENVL